MNTLDVKEYKKRFNEAMNKKRQERDAYLSAVLKRLLEIKKTEGKANAALVLEMAIMEGDEIAKANYDLLTRAIERNDI